MKLAIVINVTEKQISSLLLPVSTQRLLNSLGALYLLDRRIESQPWYVTLTVHVRFHGISWCGSIWFLKTQLLCAWRWQFNG